MFFLHHSDICYFQCSFFLSWASKFPSALIFLQPEEYPLAFIIKHVFWWQIILIFLYWKMAFRVLFLKNTLCEEYRLSRYLRPCLQRLSKLLNETECLNEITLCLAYFFLHKSFLFYPPILWMEILSYVFFF